MRLVRSLSDAASASIRDDNDDGRRCRSEELHERIHDFCSRIIRNSHGLALHVFHQAIQVVTRVGYAHNSNGRAIPEVGRAQFSGCNVEVRAELGFQAADDLAFVFEGLRVLNAEFEGEKGNHSSHQPSAFSKPLDQMSFRESLYPRHLLFSVKRRFLTAEAVSE